MFLLAEPSKLKVFICIIVLILCVFWSYDQVEAHGGVTVFKKQTVGPYEIQFGTSPRSPSPGPIHIALRIVSLKTGLTLNEASVKLSGKIQGTVGDQIGSFEPILADQYKEDPQFWDADIMVSDEGDWLFKVIIEDKGDFYEAYYDVKVQKSSPIKGIFSVIGLILFLTVLALAVRTYFKPKVAI
jgi:hypothetical protein|tara:strand:+ start:821 stop:1375 length:555 start_codon:yes stop_codon:yes gene_type:complete